MVKSTKIIKAKKQTLKIVEGKKGVLVIIKGQDYSRISFWKRVKQAIQLIKVKQSEGICLITKQEARSLGGYLLNLE